MSCNLRYLDSVPSAQFNILLLLLRALQGGDEVKVAGETVRVVVARPESLHLGAVALQNVAEEDPVADPGRFRE